MNLIKCTGLALVFCVLLLSSQCRQAPDYPSAPQISLNKVESTLTTNAGGTPVQRITFTINFTDGDGDLGLSTTGRDMQPPFNECLAQTTVNGVPVCTSYNPNFNNWLTNLYLKRNGQFELFEFPPGSSYSGRFPRLSPSDKEGPIDGTISYFIDIIPFTFPPNDTAKFDIQIRDRKLNLSNQIETEEIILNPQ